MKKITAFILSIVMLFSAVSFAATAQAPATEEPQYDSAIEGALAVALDVFKIGLNNTHVYLEPTDRENISEFCVKYNKNDGSEDIMRLGAYYNSESGEVFGTNYDRGVFDSGFAYNAYTECFYATKDCWQRDYGFTPIYDVLSKIAFDYTTKRIFFEYDGKDWMIQIWKGNYAFDMFVGGEVGVYNRPDGSFGLFYNCVTDEEMLPISLDVYSKERTYVTRDTTLTWWATGFAIADPVDPESLTMESSITFPDTEMCDAFVASVDKVDDIDYTRDGNTVSLLW